MNMNSGEREAEIKAGLGQDGANTGEVEVEENSDGEDGLSEDEEEQEEEDKNDDGTEFSAKVSSTVPAKRTAPEPNSTPSWKRGNTPKKPALNTTTAPPPTKPKPEKPKVNDFSDVVLAEEATQKSAHQLAKAKVNCKREKHQDKTDMAKNALA